MYHALKPPENTDFFHEEDEESDDNSIQGSPLLTTSHSFSQLEPLDEPHEIDFSIRPKSMLISNFEVPKELNLNTDEDLPFADTKREHATRRPHSMALLTSNSNKVMSSKQFESFRRSAIFREDSVQAGNDVDEKEEKQQAAKLRQEQDARMSVYRQSMMKLIGEPTDRHSIKGMSDKRVSYDQISSESDDLDDIPLNILQAHKFPKPVKHSVSEINSIRSAPLPSSRMPPNKPRPYNPPRSAVSTVFGHKDGTLSRGLIGEISREEEVKRKRHTIGYGVDSTLEAQAPLKPVKNKPKTDLEEKLDMVIDMLSRIQPNQQVQQIQRAPSIASFHSFEGHKSPSSLGMGEFQSPLSIPFPPPMHQQPSQMFSAPFRQSQTVLNRPSQIKLISKPVNDEDDLDLELLRKEREKLREKWINAGRGSTDESKEESKEESGSTESEETSTEESKQSKESKTSKEITESTETSKSDTHSRPQSGTPFDDIM